MLRGKVMIIHSIAGLNSVNILYKVNQYFPRSFEYSRGNVKD